MLYLPRPSVWLFWHDHLLRPGSRVLDVACGEGRHALTAAQRGAEVTALDRDSAQLDIGREAASRLDVKVDWRQVDLTEPWPELGGFDLVLVFNYLDRPRMKEILARVTPGGFLIMETYLIGQRALGWGPASDEHLLHPGELTGLVAPLEVVHGREVHEPVEGGRTRVVASVVAEKR
ncbi:MAG: class I SAM-dependent methyltransferase [Gemmatimonadales bacterium]